MARGLAPSRERARALILGGKVRVGGRPADKAGARVAEGDPIEVEAGLPYVSRGGLKLAGALDAFAVRVAGRVAVDVGASTGGFTDCLLSRGAARVYALDVGYGQLAWRLQTDPRVIRMDRVNARALGPGSLPEPCDLAAVDLSFISLRLVLAPVAALLREGAEAIVLVKPQFEVGKGRVGKGGVVRDAGLQRETVWAVAAAAAVAGYAVRGWCESPLRGADGNREFFLHLAKGVGDDRSEEVRRGIEAWRPAGA